MLIEKGADVNSVDEDNRSALIITAENGNSCAISIPHEGYQGEKCRMQKRPRDMEWAGGNGKFSLRPAACPTPPSF